jgi:hypothetical protein
VLVGERQVLTCAHVVNVALGRDLVAQGRPADEVTLDFPMADRDAAGSMADRDAAGPLKARVERWAPPLLVASGSVTEIVDATHGRVLRLLRGHADTVTAAAFPPDGTLLATASHDQTSRIWDLTDGTTLTGHDGWLRATAFSANGALLITASADRTARIWDATTGVLLVTLVPLADGGYATLLADGGYNLQGDPGDSLWWAIKLCRFAPGELDRYVPGLKRLQRGNRVLP